MRALLVFLVIAFPNAVGGSFIAGWLPGTLTTTLMLAAIACLSVWLNRMSLLRRIAGRHLSYARIRELEAEMSGYVYKGRKPDLGLDLEDLNAAIMAAREQADRRSLGPRLPDLPPGSCRRGHPRSPETARVGSDGRVRCRVCERLNDTRRKETAA